MITEFQSFIEKYKGDNEVFLATDSKNQIWLRATEVCKQLEFSDAHRTVKTYLKEHQYQELRLGMGRPALYISESGFYKLILKSKSLIAENFIDWLTEDVLPKLRASGYYIASDATSEQLEAAQIEINKLKSELETIKNKGTGISHLVDLILKNIQYNNAPQNYVSANEWLNFKVMPMFPANKFRSRFARNASELYKSVYSYIPIKHDHQMYIENYGDYINVKSNLYIVPLDLPILEHAFKTVCGWFVREGVGFLMEENEQLKTYPY